MDGLVSPIPTSLGANPQLTIYGMTARNATLSNRKAKVIFIRVQ
ncbi:protein of unknown function [Shewanella benthica]|uniref:Uncharacterized protein n=1 Tax=Shewanella benthica TaxID=43661 RepID=A0A330M166_9GAMM|nr:protein of unknown function [Shewanella benthica]